MNRIEALNILGLDSDATPKEIKEAYRETVQILHPDRFASNQKLQDRATEQFKRMQEAYEYLTSGRGAKETTSRSGSSHSYGESSQSQRILEARLAGIAAARTQLVKQRDVVQDERRNALTMIVVGALVSFFLRRIVWVAGIAGAATVWGIVQLVSSLKTLETLDEHIEDLKKEQKKLEEQLEDLE